MNRIFAEDPTPLDSNRAIRVTFKPEIVDLIVPPEDFPTDYEYEGEEEEEEEDENGSSLTQEEDEEDSDEETVRIDAEECERAVCPRGENENNRKKSGDEDDTDSSSDQTTINSSLEHEQDEKEETGAEESKQQSKHSKLSFILKPWDYTCFPLYTLFWKLFSH